MFRKLTLKGITVDEFKELFGFKKKLREKENDTLFRTAKENKGKKVKVERDSEKRLKKYSPKNRGQ